MANANANEDSIIGLKTNCKRGYNLAEFWQVSYKKSILMLLKSWSTMTDTKLIIEMAWETVGHYSHYQMVDSEALGIFSRINNMVIPEKTYTTKKGITKTIPEEIVSSHYTQEGDYIGRVINLGEKPISYKISLEITKEHFNFFMVGNTIEECFTLKPHRQNKIGDVKLKSVPKSVLKENIKK